MFATTALKQLTDYLALAEPVAKKFLETYLEEQRKIYSGEYGQRRNQTHTDDQRYPQLNDNYEFRGLDGQVIWFDSSYDYESTTFVSFALADVLTSDGQQDFFRRLRLSHGLGTTPEQTADYATLAQLLEKYPHYLTENHS